MSPEDALTLDVTVERQDSDPWWTVYCSDFVAETSSDWMDESELRDWALEFYEGTEELESVASLDLESIREMHRSHFAEFEDRMNGSEAPGTLTPYPSTSFSGILPMKAGIALLRSTTCAQGALTMRGWKHGIKARDLIS